MTANVSDLVTQLRELVNDPRRQQQLLQDTAKWNRVTSALDALGDTQEAINAYGSRVSDPTDGELYLRWYGLLQALVLQQDAAKLLAGALGVPLDLSDFEGLKIVRDTRVSAAGHPVKNDGPRGIPASSHFISRPTLSHASFELLSVTDDGEMETKEVSSAEMIDLQATGIQKALGQCIRVAKTMDEAHKEQFKDESLGDIFDLPFDCFEEKISLGATRISDRAGATDALKAIESALDSFDKTLKRRGVTYDSVKYVFSEIEDPLRKLKLFYDLVSGEDAPDAEVVSSFSSHLIEKVRELKQMAQEIDDEYVV